MRLDTSHIIEHLKCKCNLTCNQRKISTIVSMTLTYELHFYCGFFSMETSYLYRIDTYTGSSHHRYYCKHTIASMEIPLRQWNELLPLINRCCTSQQVYERELGAFVLFTILESIVEGFSQYMNELFGLFQDQRVLMFALRLHVR